MSVSFPTEQKREALRIFAFARGRRELVEQLLADAGLTMTWNTVDKWAYTRERELYAEAKREVGQIARSRAADRYHQIADVAADVSAEALRQLGEALSCGELDLKDLPKAAREAMLVSGISTDKGELLSDRPTERVSTDLAAPARELAALGIQIMVVGSNGQSVPLVDTIDARELPPGADAADDRDETE